MYLLNKAFLKEIYFLRAAVIHDLVLSFDYCIFTYFLNGACLSSKSFILLTKFSIDTFTLYTMFKIQDVTPVFKVIHDKFSLIEVTLVGCKIYGKYIQEESESINSPVPACLS